MTGMTAQLWVAGIGVALALGYTVWAAVRKFRRVQAGGSACGGCSGDACGSGGCSTGPGAAAAGRGGVDVGTRGQGLQAQPIHWQPSTGRSQTKPPVA